MITNRSFNANVFQMIIFFLVNKQNPDLEKNLTLTKKNTDYNTRLLIIYILRNIFSYLFSNNFIPTCTHKNFDDLNLKA